MSAHHVRLDPERSEDAGLMALAIETARGATMPFGCLIVRDETILARGRNQGGETGDPTAHAEMATIRAVIASHGAGALTGATLYATGEPCPMCMGAILWCGIGRLVYAASIERLATRMDQIRLSCIAVAEAGHRPIAITADVLSDEALALFAPS